MARLKKANEYNRIRSAFRLLDPNRSGLITKDEFKNYLKDLDVTNEVFDKMFSLIDYNGDGNITF